MQACTATVSLQKAASANGSTRPARRHTKVAQASARADVPSRRAAALFITAIPALLATPAFAKDADKAKAAAEARKEQLAKAAEEMRESGKTASAFSESPYAVSEDKSPNVHTRQEEGVRESAN